MPARRRNTPPPLAFDKKLVLQQWIFSLLEAKDLDALCNEEFRHPDAERWDTENVTEFHHLLTQYTVERAQLPVALLLAFDGNIVRHTRSINGRRKPPAAARRCKCTSTSSNISTTSTKQAAATS
jgi:hypothetical protein